MNFARKRKYLAVKSHSRKTNRKKGEIEILIEQMDDSRDSDRDREHSIIEIDEIE